MSCTAGGTASRVDNAERCSGARQGLVTVDQLASTVGTQATLLHAFKDKPAPAVVRRMVNRSGEANRSEHRHEAILTALCPVLAKAATGLGRDLAGLGNGLAERGQQIAALCTSPDADGAIELKKAASRVGAAVRDVQQRCTDYPDDDVDLPTACTMSMHVAIPLLEPIARLPAVVHDLDDRREALRAVAQVKPFDPPAFEEPLRTLGAVEGAHGAACGNTVKLARDHLERHLPGGAEADVLKKARDAIEAVAAQCEAPDFSPFEARRQTSKAEVTAQADALSEQIRATQRAFAAVLDGCKHSDVEPQ
ncbi:MAG: hypothetical protein KTR31_09300 [Myxococcales bacterium]|nr:hypothetical protein [Myxococcales bacterium]